MTTALAREERSELQHRKEPTIMQILADAVMNKDISVETMKGLMSMQREMVEYDGKVAFNDAMQRAQEKMRPIGADMNNPQTKSRYASYAKLDKVLRPIYSAEEFALSFNTAESHLPDHVRVLCDVSRGGYVKPYQIDMPNDGKGAKGGDVMTKTHATGAGVSYGMRYLLKMIFNVAVGEDDNDGNTNGTAMGDEEYISWFNNIEAASTIEDLQKYYRAAYSEAMRIGDKDAMGKFLALKDKRKAEINAAH